MTDLLTQSRALGDPTRHKLFQYIAQSSNPVDVAELTDLMGLHHNAIRQHLTKLVEARLVRESTLPHSGRGRPRLAYDLDPTAESRWGVIGPYERLSLLFSEMMHSGDSPVEVGKRAGKKLQEGVRTTSDPVGDLVQAMARHGFEPEAQQKGNDIVITFSSCPYKSTAISDPENVCGLHLGLAIGAAEMIEGIVVDELVEFDPSKGPCCLRCHIDK